MSLIEFKNVSKAFFSDRKQTQATVALSHVDLAIEEGEFVSLIGPSGCGKTVSLSMMAGLAQPTDGEVLFEGRPIDGPAPERGVVFQEYSLMPWLSVKQNILFALKNNAAWNKCSLDKAAAEKTAMEALSAVGLAHTADLRPNTLSGGMKQRVAIARLLALDSRVFLMDEPFSALDEQTRADLDQSLFELWKQRKKTVVFVTHNISEAVAISSRIVLFSQSPGKVIKEWRLDPDMDRSPNNPDIQRLSDQIRNLLPASSRRSGDAI